MKSDRKILFVTPHNPWGRGGGCFATSVYLNALMELFPEAEFHLCVYDDFMPQVPEHILANPSVKLFAAATRPLSQRLSSIFSGRIHRFQHLVESLVRQNSYAFAFLDKSHLTGTLAPLFTGNNGTPVFTLHHNFEPDYFRHENVSRMFRFIFHHHIGRLEKKAYLESTVNLFLTENDRHQFAEAYGETEAECHVTGFFDKTTAAVPERATAGDNRINLVISGSLNNNQNIDGINQFFHHLYPLIPAEVNITVTGQKPSAHVKALCHGKKNVTLVPDPADISSVIAGATVALCPTRLGSGIKVRVTDPLRMGIPVICHAVSGRGYGSFIKKGYICTYSNPGEFAAALNWITEALKNRTITPDEITALYNSEFGQDAGLERLRQAIMPHIVH